MKTIKNIVLYLWQLPQNLLGLCFLLFCGKERYVGDYNGKRVYYHPLMPSSWGEGISLGNYIFHDSSTWNEPVIRHEYGHCRQSIRLGPLYLLVIGLPSLIYAAGHFNGGLYTETWADKLGGVKRKSNTKK